jgi:DNA polymerase-3 subunit gamma/tau
MSKGTLYLKYRPEQLEDVVGQKYTTGTLKQASILNRFAHAYLLCGNKGCGKTTTARILANLLTCSDPKDGKVCGKCRACQTIQSGMSMDVIELDGAANGNVENVQNLIEGANWSPSELSRKVYIIDECHQLTGRAISALLKIVEEPPEYLVFIFCTTEPKKIPSTILSRAQRFNFKKITSKDIVTRLGHCTKRKYYYQ